MKRIFITGDSTTSIKNLKFKDNRCGWAQEFKFQDYQIFDCCEPGHSIRDFWNRGIFDKIFNKLQSNDILLCCHGHLETCPLERPNERARGSLHGTGNEIKIINDKFLKRTEIIHTFSWYVKEIIKKCKELNVKLFFVSPHPRLINFDIIENGQIIQRTLTEYIKIFENFSLKFNVGFINLNKYLKQYYEKIDEKESLNFYIKDKVHTNKKGAKMIAETVEKLLLEKLNE